jgi:hypothetical protein
VEDDKEAAMITRLKFASLVRTCGNTAVELQSKRIGLDVRMPDYKEGSSRMGIGAADQLSAAVRLVEHELGGIVVD